MALTISRTSPVDRLTRIVLVCCAGAPLLVLTSILVATVVTPDYHTVSDTLSQLAAEGAPHPAIIAAGLVLAGLMLQGFAWALHRRLMDRARGRSIAILIASSGLAMQTAAFVRDDPNVEGARQTLSGAVHGALASIAFVAMIVALFLFVRAMASEPGFERVRVMSRRLGWACAVIGSVFEIQVIQSIEGLLQRVFITLFAVWIEVVIFGYLTKEGAPRGPDRAGCEV